MNKKLLFIIKFFVLFFILEFLVINLPINFLNQFLANIISTLFSVPVNRATILILENSFEITNSCTGLISASILIALIFSFNKPEFFEKIKIALIGSFILLFLNIIRLFFVIGSAFFVTIEIVELLHSASWMLMSLFILIIWFYEMKLKGFEIEEMF